VKLDDIGSSILENQFMIHVLSNLTSEYDLQLAITEKRVGGKENPENFQNDHLYLKRLTFLKFSSHLHLQKSLSWKPSTVLIKEVPQLLGYLSRS
jgi:hypothetical protein